jgi:hypothetical protein
LDEPIKITTPNNHNILLPHLRKRSSLFHYNA